MTSRAGRLELAPDFAAKQVRGNAQIVHQVLSRLRPRFPRGRTQHRRWVDGGEYCLGQLR